MKHGRNTLAPLPAGSWRFVEASRRAEVVISRSWIFFTPGLYYHQSRCAGATAQEDRPSPDTYVRAARSVIEQETPKGPAGDAGDSLEPAALSLDILPLIYLPVIIYHGGRAIIREIDINIGS